MLRFLFKKMIYCRCGTKFGEHKATVIINPTGICAGCGAEIPNNVSYFMAMGNWCRECNRKIELGIKRSDYQPNKKI